MDRLIVRPIEGDDVKEVVDLAFSELPWHTPKTLLRRVSSAIDGNDNINMLVGIDAEGVVAGFGCYGRQEFCKNVHGLFMAATKKQYRGQGVGQAIINARIDAIDEIALDGDLIVVATKRPKLFMLMGFSSRPVADGTFIMERSIIKPE